MQALKRPGLYLFICLIILICIIHCCLLLTVVCFVLLQMELMQCNKVKAEIQSLAAIAPDFLTSIYLPNKLRYGGWV